MTPAARLSAAIEVLTDLIERRRPAAVGETLVRPIHPKGPP